MIEHLDRFWFSCVLLWRYALRPAWDETVHSLRRSGLLGAALLGGVVLIVLYLIGADFVREEAVVFLVIASILVAFALVVFLWTAAMEPIRLVRKLEREARDRREAEEWRRDQSRRRLDVHVKRAAVIRRKSFAHGAELDLRTIEIDNWLRDAEKAVEEVAPDRVGWFSYDPAEPDLFDDARRSPGA